MLITEDLSYFYQDAESTLVGKRPETKTESDLARVVAAGKPQAVIDKFAELVTVGKHWDWFEDYALYLNAMDTWNRWTPPEAKEGKEAPAKPEQYAGNPLDQYAVDLFKASRQALLDSATVDANGFLFDADEVSIGRMASAILAASVEADTYSMWWSLADTATGVMTNITLADLKLAHKLAVINMSTVWSV